MPKILIFYEDGMIKEHDNHVPLATNYPCWTILYDPFSIPIRWWECVQVPHQKINMWTPITDLNTINKHFRTYALIAG